VVLTGVLAETPKHGTTTKPMPTTYDVERGEALVGVAAARALGIGPGDSIQVLGKAFEVAKVLDEVGVIPEDIRVYAHLHDVQELVGKPGRINAIDALSCLCPTSVKDIIAALENSVHEVLPEVNVQPYHSILLARQKQRAMMYRFEMAALAIVMAGSAASIWGLTHQNLRNRRREIGVLRALGIPDRRIGTLFVGKILAYSIIGAGVGSGVGYLAAHGLNATQRPISLPEGLIAAVLLVTPAAAVLFGLPPILSGLLQEPADVLRDGEA